VLTKGTDGEQLWFAIHRTATILERRADALITKELGISLALFMVLSVIDAHPGPAYQQRIAGRIGITKGTVSRLVASGVAAGLISVGPSPTSRRERVATLTDDGDALIRRADAALNASQLSAYADANPEKVREATATLYDFLDSLETPGT
jgi:DNA-binding MarR family transcriptional regulator